MHINFFDLVTTLTSLSSTFYFTRMDQKAWFLGLVATLFNGTLYYKSGIYAEVFLEACYFILMLYGFFVWRKGRKLKSKPIITTLPSKQYSQLFSLTFIVYCIVYFVLIRFTNSNIPMLDALTFALSITAQWLMNMKVITTWALWFITDAIYFLLYCKKNLAFHAVLMVLYLSLAVIGYQRWLSTSKQNNVSQRVT